MIIGLIPLMIATGAGANGNKALGTGAIGGMLIGMILQVIFVPVLSWHSRACKRNCRLLSGKTPTTPAFLQNLSNMPLNAIKRNNSCHNVI